MQTKTTPAPRFFYLPKQVLQARAAYGEGEAKTTVESTTQHAQNSHRAMQAANHITISLTCGYCCSNLELDRIFEK